MNGPALEMKNIRKSFPGVRALKGVDLSVAGGEIRGLAGENGAGKSTLIKILSGACGADQGSVSIGGREIVDPSPQRMIDLGVAVIYQEMPQAPHLSVAENILMGRLPRGFGGAIAWRDARRRAQAIMQDLGFSIDPGALVGSLGVAQRQMVEIAKAISRRARIIVLDEPSAVLGEGELERLFAVVTALSRKEGVSFIYISHRLKELADLCHSVTVLRDGTVVGTRPMAEVAADDLIRMMVGRPLEQTFPRRRATAGEVVLRVRNLNRAGVLNDVSLDVRRGEILGICGLVGSGRSELLHAIAGADAGASGTIALDGEPLPRRGLRDRLARGIALLPEDRKTQGLFLPQSIRFNVGIGRRRDGIDRFFLDPKQEGRAVADLIRRLDVRTPSGATRVDNLSGGNQQKCLLARQIHGGCRVFLVDEPTRGVDVGARSDIYRLLDELTTKHGASIIMVSSDLLEVMGLCDRIVVMRQGRVAATLEARDATEQELMRHATWH